MTYGWKKLFKKPVQMAGFVGTMHILPPGTDDVVTPLIEIKSRMVHMS